MVVSLDQANIAYLPTISIIKQSLRLGSEQSGPAFIKWEEQGSVISNQDRSWRDLQSDGNKIAFGLEKRLGHIKVYQWQSVGLLNNYQQTEQDISPTNTLHWITSTFSHSLLSTTALAINGFY